MSEHPSGSPAPRGVPSVARPVAWLVAGLALFALAAVAVAPELLAAPAALRQGALVAIAAGLPGLVLLVVAALRRRSLPDDEPEG